MCDAYLLNPVYVLVVVLSVVALNAPTPSRTFRSHGASADAATAPRVGLGGAAVEQRGGKGGKGSKGASQSTKPIDVNAATAAELEQLDGIGPVLSAKIVQYRAQNGPFQSTADLLRVPGIGEKKLAKLTPWVHVSTPTTARAPVTQNR